MKKIYLIIVVISLSVLSLCIGAGGILSWQDLFHGGEGQKLIIYSRIPRLISLIIAGMGMSICGLIMQHLTKNRFVGPSVSGTADSAKLGALLAILFLPSASIVQKMLFSFVCALLGTFLFMKVIRIVKPKQAYMVPLIGMMLGGVIDAGGTFLAYQNDLVQNMASWLQADFSSILKGRYELLYLSIPILLLAYIYAHHFTLAGIGEKFSKNLGLNYQAIVNLGLIIVSCVTAIVIIIAGRIPFLGIVVPNLIALKKGDHLRKNIVAVALSGANLLLICDIFSRIIIFPYEIPIGITVSIVGSILFLYLLAKEVAK